MGLQFFMQHRYFSFCKTVGINPLFCDIEKTLAQETLIEARK